MSYQFFNQVTPEQLQQLSDPIQASAVIEELAAVAEQTTPDKTDQVEQWLKAIEANGISAQRGGGANAVTVLPGGTGSPDRIATTAVNGVVTVTGVSKTP
ncbi:DNA-binding transcriptional regulator YbjK [Lysobacter enzymogenes]|jgi:hypothetical protein|uniref:hypothetical protein n=1 Tax=Lysobacter enzymogenes TaxID=69 RepID=UPI0008995192|nr:hypothetical protein [Lysobacter enzymogenes]SDW89665.1 hypothetical protein SAMN05421681_103151 [Lysobacter enzymogenes]